MYLESSDSRSERQALTYRLDNGTLWRESQGEGTPFVQRQKLLGDVRDLSWRLFDARSGWRSDWPTGQAVDAPLALEVQLPASSMLACAELKALLTDIRTES